VTLILLLIGFCNLKGQSPYSWIFNAKMLEDKTYENHCTMDIKSHWHTYSQFTPDGLPLPTKFNFTKNPFYTLYGKVKEDGKMVLKHESVF
jgi:hypothetical protein